MAARFQERDKIVELGCGGIWRLVAPWVGEIGHAAILELVAVMVGERDTLSVRRLGGHDLYRSSVINVAARGGGHTVDCLGQDPYGDQE